MNTSTQPQIASNLATPMTGTITGMSTTNPLNGHRVHGDSTGGAHVNPDYFPPALPTFDPRDENSFPSGAPEPPRNMFKTYMSNDVIPFAGDRYGPLATQEAREAHAYQIWDGELKAEDKQYWALLHEELVRRYKKVEDDRGWSRVRETVRRRNANAGHSAVPICVADAERSTDDVVMKGVEEEG